jgi:hypothetical protein
MRFVPIAIGVGNSFRRPRPPNRACGSPAHGSPVGGFLIGIGSLTHRCKQGEQSNGPRKSISYLPLKRRFRRRQHALVPQRSFHSRPISAASLCALSNPYGHSRCYTLLSLWFSRTHLPASLPSARLCFPHFSRLSPLRYYGDSDSCAAHHPQRRSPRLPHHTFLSFRLQPRGLPEHRYHHASVPSEFRTSP